MTLRDRANTPDAAVAAAYDEILTRLAALNEEGAQEDVRGATRSPLCREGGRSA